MLISRETETPFTLVDSVEENSIAIYSSAQIESSSCCSVGVLARGFSRVQPCNRLASPSGLFYLWVYQSHGIDKRRHSSPARRRLGLMICNGTFSAIGRLFLNPDLDYLPIIRLAEGSRITVFDGLRDLVSVR